jgi:hypothetical protein
MPSLTARPVTTPMAAFLSTTRGGGGGPHHRASFTASASRPTTAMGTGKTGKTGKLGRAWSTVSEPPDMAHVPTEEDDIVFMA